MTERVEDEPLAGIETILVDRVEVDANAGGGNAAQMSGTIARVLNNGQAIYEE